MAAPAPATAQGCDAPKVIERIAAITGVRLILAGRRHRIDQRDSARESRTVSRA